jgi:hypothetical protein
MVSGEVEDALSSWKGLTLFDVVVLVLVEILVLVVDLGLDINESVPSLLLGLLLDHEGSREGRVSS